MQQSNPTEFYVVRILIIFGILIFGYFAAKIVGNFYSGSLANQPNPAVQSFQNYYQNEISLETDAYSAAKSGMGFLKSENYDLALTSFDQATVLDPKWRDGWVWKGYTELKLNKPQEAIASLKKGEEIDPLYPLTYQLLVISYQQTGDTTSAQNAQNKLSLLSKK